MNGANVLRTEIRMLKTNKKMTRYQIPENNYMVAVEESFLKAELGI